MAKTHRLNEYGYGLCSALIAYERFVTICKPLQKATLLSSEKQRVFFATVMGLTFSFFLAETAYEYLTIAHYRCLYLRGGVHRSVLINHLYKFTSSILLSLFPVLFCCRCYYATARVLLSRKKKVGRNLNLVFCFGATCVVWILALMAKFTAHGFFILNSAMTVGGVHTAPSTLKIFQFSLISLLGGITSIFDPILILVSQKDYRKTINKSFQKLREKLPCKSDGN